MPDAIKLLNVSWANFKTYKTRDNFTVYYVDGTNSVEAIGVTVNWTYYVQLFGSELTDFNTNYKSAGTEVDAIDDAIAAANIRETLDINIETTTPPFSPIPSTASDMKFLYANGVTPDTTNYNIINYTVPTGKIFHLLYYAVHTGDANANISGWIRIRSGGSNRDGTHFDTGNQNGGDLNLWMFYAPGVPIPFAVGGDKIQVRINEDGGTGGNRYNATIYGFEVDE